MKVLSLKLRDDVFKEAERVVHRIHVPRNAYINQAIRFYNLLNRRKLLKNQLSQESQITQAVSLKVLHEFEKLED